MGVRFYDQALLEKFQKWVKDPNMTILGPSDINRTFQIIADKKQDKEVRLPLIILSRNPSFMVGNISKQPLTHNAYRYVDSADHSKTVQINAVPITLNYQIDIISRYYEEADEYVRNFIFNLINYPKLSVTIPYNGIDYVHNSSISMNPEIVDNSDNSQRLFQGQFSNWTIKFDIDNAYLFSVPITRTWEITEIELDVKENDTEYSKSVIPIKIEKE